MNKLSCTRTYAFESRELLTCLLCFLIINIFLISNLSNATMAYQTSSRSPPPLLHPVPTHPTYIPEPPSTPASPQGYQRFASTSSPPPPAPQGYFTQNPNGNPRQPYASQFSPPRQQPPQLHQQNQGYPAPGGNIRPGPNAQVPDFSAWGLDGATTQLGMQLGHSAVQAGQDYVQQNVCHIFSLSNTKLIAL